MFKAHFSLWDTNRNFYPDYSCYLPSLGGALMWYWKFYVYSYVNDLDSLGWKKMVISVRLHLSSHLAQALRLTGILMALWMNKGMWTIVFCLSKNLLNALSGRYCHQGPLCHHTFKSLLTILKNFVHYKLYKKKMSKKKTKGIYEILTVVIFG